MDSVHELVVANVVVLWLAVAATAIVMLRRRRDAAPQNARYGMNRAGVDAPAGDWQPGT